MHYWKISSTLICSLILFDTDWIAPAQALRGNYIYNSPIRVWAYAQWYALYRPLDETRPP
jgi:hypothetical protein